MSDLLRIDTPQQNGPNSPADQILNYGLGGTSVGQGKYHGNTNVQSGKACAINNF